MKRIALVCLLAFVLPAVAARGGNAFQGLSWGASEAQIRKAFPQARHSECTETWRHLSKITHSVCSRPEIVPYEVAGIPFKLRFDLAAATGRLKAVVLFYSGTAAGEESSVKLRLRARFDALAEGLETRYGAGDAPFVREKSGQLYLAQTWTTPATSIELTAVCYDGGNEEYQVWYRPRGGEAAEKL